MSVDDSLSLWWYFFFDVGIDIIMVVKLVRGLQLLFFNRGLGFGAYVGEHVVKEILGAILRWRRRCG